MSMTVTQIKKYLKKTRSPQLEIFDDGSGRLIGGGMSSIVFEFHDTEDMYRKMLAHIRPNAPTPVEELIDIVEGVK